MNYFELHIGDYAEATSHLTFVEDAAYIRMIRKYYATEKPLPADVKAVQRLVGARTKEEREAVTSVLEEFFVLAEDGWHNHRCDVEIARFREGEPEREAKKANEDNRMKRHREERARLFKLLTDAGHHAAWNIGMNELRDLVKRVAGDPPVTHDPPLPATAPATPATATQSPISNHQTPVLKTNPQSSSQASNGVGAVQQRDDDQREEQGLERDAQIAALLRDNGVPATSTHEIVRMTWAPNARITDEVLLLAIAKAQKAKPGEDIPLKYLAKTVVTVLEDQDAPAPAITPRTGGNVRRTPQAIEAKGRELGIPARAGESYEAWATRIDAEIAKRQGQAA